MQDPRNRRQRMRALVILLLVLLALLAVFAVLHLTGRLSILSSEQAFREWVQGFGAAAPIIFCLMQVVQVIVSPIPGNATTVVGGMLFGFWPAFGLSTAAIFVGSVLAFALARRFGRPLVARIAGPEVTERYLGALNSRARIALILMFLLPFFPDDVLCLAAGLTGISWVFFLLAVACARPWGLLFSSLVGSGIVRMPIWGWGLLVAGSIALAWASMKWGPSIEQRLYRRITSGVGNDRSTSDA